MKTIKYVFSLILAVTMFTGCNNDDDNLDVLNSINAPTDVSAVFNVMQDNSGMVLITPNATGAATYNITLGDGVEEPVVVLQGENTEHVYDEGTYTVTIEAVSITGLTTEVTQELVVSFRAPENLEITAEIDAANPFQINVSAEADFAASFEVFFDTSNPDEEPTLLALGETVSFEYPLVGDYTIRVVALSGGVESTEATVVVTITTPTELPIDFEIFDTTVFFGFGGATGEIIDNPDMNGNASAKVARIVKGPPEVWAGNVIELSAPMDFSTRKLMKFDVWSPRPGGTMLLKLENLNDGNIFIEVEATLVGNGAWEEVSFDLTDIPNLETESYQKVVWFFDFGTVGDGSADWTFYVDNIRLESTAPFNDGLLTNGNFEDGSDPWIVGIDDNSPISVVTEDGNTYYSVNVETAGDAFAVNMSQKVEIIQDETYTLVFDAWSDTNRSIVAGIGLSGPPFSAAVETVDITPTITTYTLSVVASGWGAPDARVLFDLGAEIGLVNIDNVSLFLGDGPFDSGLLVNGDFEAGSEPWIVGVDDNAPITVVTDAGNTYYSVNVVTAGDAFAVNMSQKLEIIQDQTYTLTFDAWSDTNRSIVAGIGLSGPPFSAAVETVDITTTVTTYSLTLVASGWGAPDARVLFDSGADVGIVNIDNVSLTAD